MEAILFDFVAKDLINLVFFLWKLDNPNYHSGEVSSLFKNALVLNKEYNVYQFQFEETGTKNYFELADGEFLLSCGGKDARFNKLENPDEICQKAIENKKIGDFVSFVTIKNLKPEIHMQTKKVYHDLY